MQQSNWIEENLASGFYQYMVQWFWSLPTDESGIHYLNSNISFWMDVQSTTDWFRSHGLPQLSSSWNRRLFAGIYCRAIFHVILIINLFNSDN